MDFKNISNYELTQRLEKLVRTERKITHLILLHINEVESRRIYAESGFDGMFSYLTKGLGYSESSAYRRMQSARLLKQVPSVAEKLESGAVNLSQLTQIQKCLKEEMKSSGNFPSQERTEKLIAEIAHKNSFETQKVLAVEFKQPIQISEKVKPQADDSVRLEITLTQLEFADLLKAKDLLSHVCPGDSLSDVISTLARKFIKSRLGKEFSKQGFCATETTNENKATSGIFNHNSKRAYISINTKRNLLTFANHRCQFKDRNGKSCDSTYQLQVDHIFPKALGGSEKPENLRILCRIHNNFMAKELGLNRRS